METWVWSSVVVSASLVEARCIKHFKHCHSSFIYLLTEIVVNPTSSHRIPEHDLPYNPSHKFRYIINPITENGSQSENLLFTSPSPRPRQQVTHWSGRKRGSCCWFLLFFALRKNVRCIHLCLVV